MAYSVWIEGVDKTSMVGAGSLRLSFRSTYDNSCTLIILTTAAGYIPDVGQDIQVKEDSVVIWGGVIKSLTVDKLQSGLGTDKKLEITVSSDGYKSIPSRRTVNLTYDQKTAGFVVDAIATILSTEGITAGSINAGASVVGENGEYDAICKSCAEVLDDMATASGYIWYIDEDKNLSFFEPNVVVSAAHDIVEGGAFTDFAIESYEIGLDPYANKVFVRGGIGDDGVVVSAYAEDTTEQTARIASEGGTGVYGAVITDTNIYTTADAQAAADIALRRNGVIPRTLVISSGTNDWWPGTKLKVNLPTLGLAADTYFLIEDVTLEDVDGINLRSRITATSRKASDWSNQANQTGIEYLGKVVSGASSGGGGGGAMRGVATFVETTAPTGMKDKDILVDTDDFSRYDRGTAATTCSIDPRLTELYEFTGSSAFTATITNTGLTAGCILKLINSSTVTVTLSATINGSTIYRMHPLDGLDLIWNGTDWRVVGASSSIGSAKMNSDGGYMVRMTNRTGGTSVKGEVVCASSSYNSAVAKIVQNVPDPIGCFYESGIADGAEAWVVVSGRAQVYFIGNTTHGHLARGFVTSDSGYVTGQALSEAVPSSPFATDKHFYEIGHVIESRTGAGLAWTMLHFN